jgi:FlaA1/EpsC-like NDP-sugar epimerase
MTRFNISLEEGVNLVIFALANAWGGEIFVPKIPSYRILDVATAIAPKTKPVIVGIRPGEKLHEEMITEMDSYQTFEFEKYYVLKPAVPTWSDHDYLEKFKGKAVEQGFRYSSGNNSRFLSVDEIRQQIREHVDPNFVPDA